MYVANTRASDQVKGAMEDQMKEIETEDLCELCMGDGNALTTFFR